MTGFEDKVLGGIVALLIVLIVGTVFGRLYGSSGTKSEFIGDRVACGLLALPLISLAVRLAFPHTHIAWVLSAPVPLAIYVVLLAVTDHDPVIVKDSDQNAGNDKNIGWAKSIKKFIKKHFTATLVLAIMLIYLAMAVCAWLLLT